MGNIDVGTTRKEKVLGITLSVDLMVSEQCGIVLLNSNQIL